jgi:MFS family permease
MAVATMLLGIFLLFTISSDASYQLAFSSIEAFFQNVTYGVLYAYTPEVFPAPNRGTGTGISSFLNGIGGLCAPIIAANIAGASPNAPIFVSGALILAAFVAMIFLPMETRESRCYEKEVTKKDAYAWAALIGVIEIAGGRKGYPPHF